MCVLLLSICLHNFSKWKLWAFHTKIEIRSPYEFDPVLDPVLESSTGIAVGNRVGRIGTGVHLESFLPVTNDRMSETGILRRFPYSKTVQFVKSQFRTPGKAPGERTPRWIQYWFYLHDFLQDFSTGVTVLRSNFDFGVKSSQFSFGEVVKAYQE